MEKKIAIRGHKTRGRDVIQALEGMGGTNEIGFDGSDSNCGYYIRHDLMISLEKLDKPPLGESYSLYTIEEYEEYMKNLEANTDCAKKLVEEETKPNITEEAKTYWDSIKDAWICPEGYIFKDENGNVINATKIVLEKKKKEYPKTYEECCKVLNIAVRDLDILDNMLDTTEIIYSKNLDRLLNSFRKILICRDAYWKIAGEEMGLGKPWEPDWEDKIYYVYYERHRQYEIGIKKAYCHCGIRGNRILVFPTEEMVNAFYENFKELINKCKELL